METKNQAAVELGRRGGIATRDKLGNRHFARIALLSAAAKRAKKPMEEMVIKLKS